MKRIVMALALVAFASSFAFAADQKDATKAPQERSTGIRYELAKLRQAFLEKAHSFLSPTPLPTLGLAPVSLDLDPDCGKAPCRVGEPGCRVSLVPPCSAQPPARPGHLLPRLPDYELP
jgi:hypothetical protein